MKPTVVGVFWNAAAAQHASAYLTESGIAPHRIVLSASLTEDGIAAEAPGQSYENQGENADTDADLARYGEAVRAGACLLSVTSESNRDSRHIAHLMRQTGAQGIMQRPQ